MCKIPLCRCVSKLFAMPWAAGIVLLAGVGTLATAFIAQYFFKVQPCELCWWQRAPYAVVIVLGVLALVMQQNKKRAHLLLGVSSAVFLISVGLALYHVGVEQHWWADSAGCAVKPLGVKDIADISLNDLRNQLLATAGVPCDEITWTFLGLSMATWNVFFSFAMFVFAAMAAAGCVSEGKPCGCCCAKKE